MTQDARELYSTITADEALADIEMAAAILAVATSPAHAATELRRIADEIAGLAGSTN